MELSAGQTIVEGLDGATLKFDSLNPILIVPCTFTPIVKDLQIPNDGGGFTSLTSIGIVLFRAALMNGARDSSIKKGLNCILTPTPGADPMPMQLWSGGLMPGAALYKFMLVDRFYKA